ncbi:MAG: ABC transporter ATP-binding protein [Acidobacteriota bacterium]
MHAAPATLLQLSRLSRHFPTPEGPFPAVDDVSFDLVEGETVALVGRSGSGKTTLLHLLAGLDRPTHGALRFRGEPLHERSEEQLAAWRARHVGVVFQFFQLLPTLTVLENVLLPRELAGEAAHGGEATARGLELLERVGVADQARKFPEALSGGQQQRVAIARALVNEPALLIADEPTGNLDSQTSKEVAELFTELAGDGTTLVLATHEPDLAQRADRILRLVDGRLATTEAA